MAVVIDTDVVSFVFKRDTRADDYRPHLEGEIAIISFMTLAELRRWTRERNWGAARRRELEEFLGGYAVFYADDDLCSVWADVMSSARRKGRPIAMTDAFVAATALLLNLPLVTHNRADFVNVDGLSIISFG